MVQAHLFPSSVPDADTELALTRAELAELWAYPPDRERLELERMRLRRSSLGSVARMAGVGLRCEISHKALA